MTWLVTGGAGYIGSHVVRELLATGHRAVVFDDLSGGYASRIPDGVALVRAPITDRAALDHALSAHRIDGVVHLAALKSVAGSLASPLEYYRQNLYGLTVLLEAMAAAAVSRLVFSSSAAVYGPRSGGPLIEDSPVGPVHPYGHTKLAGEQLIRACGTASGLSWIALRYFNAGGTAEPQLRDRGGDNLLPRVFGALTGGPPLTIHGTNHPTPDGTCVRDYVHVSDIATAHSAAAAAMTQRPFARVLNVGTGSGTSVLDVIRRAEAVTGQHVPVIDGPARPADAPTAVADVRAIGRELGWRARHDLDDIVTSAWTALDTPRLLGSGAPAR